MVRTIYDECAVSRLGSTHRAVPVHTLALHVVALARCVGRHRGFTPLLGHVIEQVARPKPWVVGDAAPEPKLTTHAIAHHRDGARGAVQRVRVCDWRVHG